MPKRISQLAIYFYINELLPNCCLYKKNNNEKLMKDDDSVPQLVCPPPPTPSYPPRINPYVLHATVFKKGVVSEFPLKLHFLSSNIKVSRSQPLPERGRGWLPEISHKLEMALSNNLLLF